MKNAEIEPAAVCIAVPAPIGVGRTGACDFRSANALLLMELDLLRNGHSRAARHIDVAEFRKS
jgi:hypothetical protein